MKHLIIVLFVALSMSVHADVVRNGDTFKVEKAISEDTKTKYTWEDEEGNKYPIFITAKGVCYIFKISKKTNKVYKRYLPKDIQEQIKKEYNETTNPTQI